MKISYCFFLFLSYVFSVQSFLAPLPKSVPTTSFHIINNAKASALPVTTTATSTTTTLFNARYDGTSGRGLVLFGFTIFLCVWLFSIPPEFRRAYFCSPACEENPMYCNDCVTPQQWVSGIVEYYQNGGECAKLSCV